jgi:hypothetical protein
MRQQRILALVALALLAGELCCDAIVLTAVE